MTGEEQVLTEIRDMITALPAEAQIKVASIAMTLRIILKADQLAGMALALVGAEEAAK